MPLPRVEGVRMFGDVKPRVFLGREDTHCDGISPALFFDLRTGCILGTSHDFKLKLSGLVDNRTWLWTLTLYFTVDTFNSHMADSVHFLRPREKSPGVLWGL